MAKSIDISKQFENLKINNDTDINVLLLGHSGVGKSTFINAIANYLDFKTMKEALENDIRVLIPATFSVCDEKHTYHQMKIGAHDQNETEDIGESATQNVKTYVFGVGDGTRRLRLIDTPGIVDTRGIKQDDVNCENILAYIGQFEQLHAIVLLMDPTNTRITVVFEYCIKQILARLEKSAAQNIVFGFTRTRGTNYEPGDTLENLRKMLDDMKSASSNKVDIPLSNNLFCFDNEAFRYLVGVKHGVKFSEANERNCHESWRVSAKASRRLISYITGNDKYPGLKPHKIRNTVCINEARRLITQLSQPISEISQLIFDNIRILERHRILLNMDNQTLDEMKAKLYIPAINLKVTQLSQPVTVCASSKCVEILKIEGVNRRHYRQRCHNPCYLSSVPKEMIGDPGLLSCAAMNGTQSCTECKCDFSVHMHVYYETETFNDKVVDDVVQSNITNKEMALKESKKIIKDINDRRTAYEGERDTIIKTTAKFAHFLQNNAITPYNDSYRKYIDYIISREESLGDKADQRLIQDLQQLLIQYDEQKAMFDKSFELAKATAGGNQQYDVDSAVTSQDIILSVSQLYKLKYTGKKIKELMKTQNTSHANELYQTCEYNHPINKKNKKPKNKNNKKSSSNSSDNKSNCKNNKGDSKSNNNTRDNRQTTATDKSKNNNLARNAPPPPYHEISNQPNSRPPNYRRQQGNNNNDYSRGRSIERNSSKNKILVQVEIPPYQSNIDQDNLASGGSSGGPNRSYSHWQRSAPGYHPPPQHGRPFAGYPPPAPPGPFAGYPQPPPPGGPYAQYYDATSYNNYPPAPPPPYFEGDGDWYNRFHYNHGRGKNEVPTARSQSGTRGGGAGRGNRQYPPRRTATGGRQTDDGNSDSSRGGRNKKLNNDGKKQQRRNDVEKKSKPVKKFNNPKSDSSSSSSSSSDSDSSD